MKVLVASGSGKTGELTAEALHKIGVDVILGSRNPENASARWPGAVFVKFDYADPETFAAALAGVDAIYSAAPFETLPASEEALIAAAKLAGVKKIVKLSALGVDQDPTSPHRVSEIAIENSGLDWTILRPTFFMQNYSTTSAATINGANTIFEPAEDGASAFVDARDIADVAAAALTDALHNGKVYALTGPETLTRAEVAEKLSTVTGRSIGYVSIDDAALRDAMAGAPQPLIELLSMLFGLVRAGHTAFVTDGVQEALGRPPRSFDTYAKDHASVWKVAA
ncbi:MAG: SDR family oxidoreductase [Alphaproteobacteria bacterium]|nr:SDR family oxidoreductase [Alphaproteobacteria bacterium]